MAEGRQVARARAAWGDRLPDWVEALARACDGESQGKVGLRIGYSAAVVNQVVGNDYRGDMAAVERAVRGAFLGLSVECPVLGEISTVACRGHQARSFQAASSNSVKVRLFRTCPSCPHRRTK